MRHRPFPKIPLVLAQTESLGGSWVATEKIHGAQLLLHPLEALDRALVQARGTQPLTGPTVGARAAGEPAELAVARELAEETGLVGRVVREVGSVRREAPSGGTYVIRDFLLEVGGDDPVAGDDALDVMWCAPADLATMDTSAGLVEALTDWGLLA